MTVQEGGVRCGRGRTDAILLLAVHGNGLGGAMKRWW